MLRAIPFGGPQIQGGRLLLVWTCGCPVACGVGGVQVYRGLESADSYRGASVMLAMRELQPLEQMIGARRGGD